MTTSRAATATDRLGVCEGVSVREFDGEWIVLDLNGGNYFGLDQLGGAIWQELSAGKSPVEVVALLGKQYEVEEAIMLRDVLGLVDELIERRLMRIGG